MAARAKLTWPLLGKISQKEFLSRYWQKKPLLMKRAIHPFPEIITPEEIAGMSLDKQVDTATGPLQSIYVPKASEEEMDRAC